MHVEAVSDESEFVRDEEKHFNIALEDRPNGVFATRATKRRNAIGLSTVEIINVKDTILHIENAGILDNTPLLDIKPYVSQFDTQNDAEMGWYSKAKYNVMDKESDLRSE